MKKNIIFFTSILLFSFIISANIGLSTTVNPSACAYLSDPTIATGNVGGYPTTYLQVQISNTNCGGQKITNAFELKFFDENENLKKTDTISIYGFGSSLKQFSDLSIGAYTIKLFYNNILQDEKKTTFYKYNDGICSAGETCTNSPNECGYCDGKWCSYDSQCQNKHCVHGYCRATDPYCGDGPSYCDSNKGEDCSTCPTDCTCPYGKQCINKQCKIPEGSSCSNNDECSTGFCVHNTCRSSDPFCGDNYCDNQKEECKTCKADCSPSKSGNCQYNGRCDIEIEENCKSSNDCSCASNEDCKLGDPKANANGCVKKCGNGIVDYGENCDTCAEDAGCRGDLKCLNGNCVICRTSNDCVGKSSWRGEFLCDGSKRTEKGTLLSGECVNHECVGSIETTRTVEDCGARMCQDGQCGCSEGYEACRAANECKQIGIINDGEPCKCDFQCKSSFCSNDKCLTPINVAFSSEMETIVLNGVTKIFLSADNTQNQPVPTQLTLSIGTGASMSAVISGQHCTGNQCKGSTTIPAKSRTTVEIEITGTGASKIELTALVTSNINGKDYPVSKEMIINVINCGDGSCTEGESIDNCCKDCGCPASTGEQYYTCEKNKCVKKLRPGVIVGAIVLIIVATGIILLIRGSIIANKKKKEEYEKGIHETKEKEKERERIRKFLGKMRKDIEKSKPSVSAMKKKLMEKFDYTPDSAIFREEYLAMLDEISEDEETQFCGECGAKISGKEGFCGECGAKV